MADKNLHQIFKAGSRTYFYSSVFFPKEVREEVFILYSFVRKADNYVDCVPQQKEKFLAFKNAYKNALDGEEAGDLVIDSFVGLMRRKQFDRIWVDAFFKSMEMDIYKNDYSNMEETIEYMYGSAEVIGLMMSQLMGLPPVAFEYAGFLGRAMQYINFIRDIKEDLELGRTYLPRSEREKFGLNSLDESSIRKNQEAFQAFIRSQINIYRGWQKKGVEGYRYIPKRYRIAIETAADMYAWTANQIYADPRVIYKRVVKPSKTRILFSALGNILWG